MTTGEGIKELEHVVTLCGSCSCGCPTIALDHNAPEDQQVIITDDFQGTVRMSRDQFRVLLDLAREGKISI